MQIKIKSSRIIKEGERKNGTPYKWVSVIADDGSEKGTEYTTFDQKPLKLGSGSVIDIGDPKTKEGKLSFEKVVSVISEVVAVSNHNGEKHYGKSPEMVLAEIDSRFRNTSLMQACDLAKSDKIKTEAILNKADEFYYWLKNGKGNPSTEPAKSPVPKKVNESKANDLKSLEFNNPGEFYDACYKYFKLPKSKTDSEISGYDLQIPEQRREAWLLIIANYGNDPDKTQASGE